jgi:hypothetical protein
MPLVKPSPASGTLSRPLTVVSRACAALIHALMLRRMRLLEGADRPLWPLPTDVQEFSRCSTNPTLRTEAVCVPASSSLRSR